MALVMTGRSTARPSHAAANNPDLIKTLYDEQASTLQRARLPKSDGEEPLDLVHDAFVKLLGLGPDRLLALKHERPVAYLWQVARRVGLDQLKRDARRSIARHLPLADDELPSGDAVRDVEARDQLRRVEQAVQAMPPRTRAIFVAHRVDGMSYAEIAERCGISAKGVEKQMGKAIAILARELTRYPDA